MKLRDLVGKRVFVNVSSYDEDGNFSHGNAEGVLSGVEGTMVFFDVLAVVGKPEEQKRNVWLNTSSLLFNGMFPVA